MDLLSISDAAKLTGRHEKTIRRWIKRQLDTDPQAKEKIIQEAVPSGFSYRINREYLLAHSPTPLDSSPGQGDGRSPTQGDEQDTGQHVQPPNPLIVAKDETIALLKDQVGRQEEELKVKNEQIKMMMERLREQNILLKGYQERYLLEAPRGGREMDGTVDNTPDNPHGQDTVQTPGQGRQVNPPFVDANHEQKEDVAQQREVKTARKHLHRQKPKQGEQTRKKGFFSFLRGK